MHTVVAYTHICSDYVTRCCTISHQEVFVLPVATVIMFLSGWHSTLHNKSCHYEETFWSEIWCSAVCICHKSCSVCSVPGITCSLLSSLLLYWVTPCLHKVKLSFVAFSDTPTLGHPHFAGSGQISSSLNGLWMSCCCESLCVHVWTPLV